MMFKRLKIWLVLLLVGAGITAGGAGYMKYQEHKEREVMLEIVKSEEAREVFEKRIKYLDEKALTDEGIIRTYKIDYDSVRRNPMGGIIVTVYINNDKNLYIRYDLDKDPSKNTYSASGGYSASLKRLLSEGKE
ncbi:DUF1310 family protein [Streptococcus chenjunshii]|uniref:DUF1310 family protein n=2 Tax=Streptococcus chenjunshii TaxID=2173853 RepID=A0A372KJM3_9STRE|nr:DUF1310 family protein [Streptococcus chenjunshii]AXQ77871.1 DUF1310 family protein [Streptococcus chenjunshii]RFU52134.1 DUF1310 family protein [Streptococcus chenjunshii]